MRPDAHSRTVRNAMKPPVPVNLPARLPAARQGQSRLLLPVWAAPAAHLLLTSTGSMTRGLEQQFSAPVSVRVLRQYVGLPTALEARITRRSVRGGWWCREILLCAGTVPVLCARTAVPPDARRLQAATRRLAGTPLMTLLFDGDSLRTGVARGPRRFGRDPDGHWWRQTCYRVQDEPLLLFEALLPAAMAPGSLPVC